MKEKAADLFWVFWIHNPMPCSHKNNLQSVSFFSGKMSTSSRLLIFFYFKPQSWPQSFSFIFKVLWWWMTKKLYFVSNAEVSVSGCLFVWLFIESFYKMLFVFFVRATRFSSSLIGKCKLLWKLILALFKGRVPIILELNISEYI